MLLWGLSVVNADSIFKGLVSCHHGYWPLGTSPQRRKRQTVCGTVQKIREPPLEEQEGGASSLSNITFKNLT
jgi:hypothetical protein